MQIVPVVFSTDHNFIMPTGVAIKSLLQHSEDCIAQIYILHSEDVTDEDKTILTKICVEYEREIRFIYCGDKIKNAFEIRNITTPTYYRLLIPWLIPEFDKIIYCDGDIVFLQSILKIYSYNIGENYIAGVCTEKATSIDPYYLEKLGLNNCEYVNGGVLLINAAIHRDLNLKAQYFEHLKKQYTYQDQDIVNIVCKGHIGKMPIWFNTTTHILKYLINKKEFSSENGAKIEFFRDSDFEYGDYNSPVIVHYISYKPWKEFGYYWSAWWDIYRKTIFYNPSKELEIEHNTICKEVSLKTTLSLRFRKSIPGIMYFWDKLKHLKNRWLN